MSNKQKSIFLFHKGVLSLHGSADVSFDRFNPFSKSICVRELPMFLQNLKLKGQDIAYNEYYIDGQTDGQTDALKWLQNLMLIKIMYLKMSLKLPSGRCKLLYSAFFSDGYNNRYMNSCRVV